MKLEEEQEDFAMLSLSYGVQIQNAQNFRFHNW
jgi:hypothetical protein